MPLSLSLQQPRSDLRAPARSGLREKQDGAMEGVGGVLLGLGGCCGSVRSLSPSKPHRQGDHCSGGRADPTSPPVFLGPHAPLLRPLVHSAQCNGCLLSSNLRRCSAHWFIQRSFHPVNPEKKSSYQIFRHIHGILNEVYL